MVVRKGGHYSGGWGGGGGGGGGGGSTLGLFKQHLGARELLLKINISILHSPVAGFARD